MTKMTIHIYPDKLLKTKAKPFDKIRDRERRFAEDMIETMRSAKGIGLAGPQVGIKKRIIVVEAIKPKEAPLVLFNPKILQKSGSSVFCEGCLSVPDVMCDVVRPEKIVVEAKSLQGTAIKIQTSGLLARVIQHEVDHLDGILFIDRVNFFKRRKLIKEISSKACRKL